MVESQREKQEIEDRKNEILARLESFEEKMVVVQREKQELTDEVSQHMDDVKELESSLSEERMKTESLQKCIYDLADEIAVCNEGFIALEREREAKAIEAEAEQSNMLKVQQGVEKKTIDDLKKELKSVLGQMEEMMEKVEDAERENGILSSLLKAEREANIASKNKRRGFGRK